MVTTGRRRRACPGMLPGPIVFGAIGESSPDRPRCRDPIREPPAERRPEQVGSCQNETGHGLHDEQKQQRRSSPDQRRDISGTGARWRAGVSAVELRGAGLTISEPRLAHISHSQRLAVNLGQAETEFRALPDRASRTDRFVRQTAKVREAADSRWFGEHTVRNAG
jgi:hypothetical protein